MCMVLINRQCHMLVEKVTERQSIGVKLCLSRILYAYRGDLSGLAMDPPVSTPAGFIHLQELPRPFGVVLRDRRRLFNDDD